MSDAMTTLTVKVTTSPRPEWFRANGGNVALCCDPPDPWWRCCRCGLGFKQIVMAEAHRRACGESES